MTARPRPRPRRHLLLPLLLAAVAALALPGCGEHLRGVAPRCAAGSRLAIVAQSVPDAAYVPCVGDLPAGWSTSGLDVRKGRTRFLLVSDRAAGRPVEVVLAPACDISAATPAPPRAVGARTYIRLRSISPRYAGILADVFPGGCVTYRFDFERGVHISLMDDFERAVSLFPRRQLAFDLHQQLGVELDP